MAKIEEPPLCRLERRQQFRWFHRIAPVLVIQAYAVVYVIKLWDEYFDVTGMVKFGVGLLMVVLSMHLVILEGLLYVKTHATDCIQIYNSALSMSADNQDRRQLDPESLDLPHKTENKYEDKPGDFFPLGREYSLYGRTDKYLANYPGKERYSPMTSSSESSWTEDSDSSSSQSSDYTSSTSSTSSSYCNISVTIQPTTGAASSSSSYCEIDITSGTAASVDYQISSTTISPVSSVNNKPSVDNVSSELFHDNPSHNHQSDLVEEITMAAPSTVAIDGTQTIMAAKTQILEVPKPKLVDYPTPRISSLPDIGTLLCRLKSLQDVYVVVDVFKALLCLDILRQLLVYYSIFYWRLSIIQTLPVFVLPSVAIIGEVSLTVVCFIT